MDGSTPAPTGQDVDRARAFLAQQHERETMDEVRWTGREVLAAGVPRDVLWALRAPIFEAAQTIARDVPPERRGEARLAALRTILAGAQVLTLARPRIRVRRLHSRAVTAAPRPVRVVRPRTRERRSSPAARGTSSTSSGDSSDPPGSSDGDGEPPPPPDPRRASQDRGPA